MSNSNNLLAKMPANSRLSPVWLLTWRQLPGVNTPLLGLKGRLVSVR